MQQDKTDNNDQIFFEENDSSSEDSEVENSATEVDLQFMSK